ncbi:MAG: hypothetical protein AB7Q00_03925 [Phycisphaerales bacterium]
MLSVVRDVIGRLLQQLPNGWGSVTQIANALGIERTLAWKISRVGSAPDPFAAAQHLPGDRAMRRVWDAFAQIGADAALLDEARSALARFRSLEGHAEDRASLSLLVGAQATRGREDLDLTQRRAAFRASSYFLGASAHVLYDATFFVRSKADPEFVDLATIRGYRGLACLRHGVAWPIARRVTSVEPDGQVAHMGQPLIPEDVEQGVPVLRRFGSLDMPALIRTESSDGISRFAIEPRGLGKQGALDVFVGERYTCVTRATPTPSEPNHAVAVHMRTPSRIAVIEQYIHRDLFGPLQMRASAGSLVFGEPNLDEIQRGPEKGRGLHIPLFEKVEHLGRADRAQAVRELRDHQQMAAFGACGLGVDLSEMDLYRLTIEYPPEPSVVVMSAPLPTRE